MLFEREVLARYSEFLDQQGLVVGDGAKANDELAVPRKADGEDKRTHEQLVEDFLASEREPWDEGVMPPGWVLPDQRVAELEMELAELKRFLRHEEGRRASAERLMADRAHYVPREEYDALRTKAEALDSKYAESMALHLRRDEDHARLERLAGLANDQSEFFKERLVTETGRLRMELTKAHAMMAGAHPPVLDADLARVLYEVMLPGNDWSVNGPLVMNTSGYEALSEEDRALWQQAAEALRAKWSTVEVKPLPYDVLVQDWGILNDDHGRLMAMLAKRVPGLQIESAAGASEAVDAVLTCMEDIVKMFVSLGQSLWPVFQSSMRLWGYDVRDGLLVRVVDWEPAQEAPEPTQPHEDGVWAGLAERATSSAQAAERQPFVYALDEAEGPADAARRFAGEIERLAEGLRAEGIELRPGPVHGAAVDTALVALQNYWSPKLGLATTRMLLDELRARAGRNAWPGWATENVVMLKEGLDEDELTYKTASGRSEASASDAGQGS